ncbi:MAG: hypothetical protein CMO44_17930 [Verrucomicrobiales bacterium]|nr:hypothetical protein [Verrucomicrobiales bacterium]
MDIGFCVIHFADKTYGIVNFDYINEIEAVQHEYARPFRYLMGLEKSGTDDDNKNLAEKVNGLFKNFNVERNTFYEMIYFLKYLEYSEVCTDLKQIYLLGIRLGIGNMADLCNKASKDFIIPNFTQNTAVFDDDDELEENMYLQSYA